MKPWPLLLVLASCSSPAMKQLHVSVPADAVDVAQQAADQWGLCGANVRISVDDPSADVIMRRVEVVKCPDVGNYLGCYIPAEHRIIYSIIDPLVFAHEMGHALGLQHAEHGVMRPVVEGPVDQQACAALHSISE